MTSRIISSELRYDGIITPALEIARSAIREPHKSRARTQMAAALIVAVAESQRSAALIAPNESVRACEALVVELERQLADGKDLIAYLREQLGQGEWKRLTNAYKCVRAEREAA